MTLDGFPIYCLNLDRATDRWDRMTARAAELGHTLLRFPASAYRDLTAQDLPPAWLFGNPDATSKGNSACSYTHYRFWQFLEQSEFEYACVLEDDAYLLRPLQNLKVPDDFDLFYLSNRVQVQEAGAPLLVNGCGTEAYVVHRRAVPKLLQVFSDVTVPVDLRLQAHMRGFRHSGHSLCAPVRADALPKDTYISRQYPEIVLEAYGARVPYVHHDDQGYSYINEVTTTRVRPGSNGP